MNLEDFRRESRNMNLPPDVLAAVDLLLAHAQQRGSKVAEDHSTGYLSIGRDAEGADASAILSLCLELL